MDNCYYQPMKMNLTTFKGQFLLTKRTGMIPKGWSKYEDEKSGWYLGILEIQILNVVNDSGQQIGWCIGYPLIDNTLWMETITIPNCNKFIDMNAIEKFYNTVGGKYILILLLEEEAKIFLDPFGSLGVIYSKIEKTIASTLILIPNTHSWDLELINILNMPESGLWFPSGLTAKIGVQRLLPNHCLDINEWKIMRHWPKLNSNLQVDNDKQKSLTTIISYIKSNIEAVTNDYPIYIGLTAGRDSRMLLACARELLSQVTFFTFAEKRETIDMYMASKLADRFNLNHIFIPIQYASEEELIQWLSITGYSVSGVIWKIHKSLQSLEQNRVLLPGIAGEVGRCFYWRQGDSVNMEILAEDLLSRAKLPLHDRLLVETDKWLKELTQFNAFQILDLFYLEQRLGCWAAPQPYGNTTSIFELSPFNHRQIFTAMMKLPYTYRMRQELTNDICRILWPELLEFPFNEFMGYRNYVYKSKKQYRRITRRAKKLLEDSI